MAPEQAVAGYVGPWTDLYALGVVLFELLTGEVPFGDARTPVALLLRRGQEPPPDLLAHRPELDPSFAAWIRTLLAIAPAARPQSAADAWSTLEPIATALAGPDWTARSSLLQPASAPVGEESGYVTYHEPLPPSPDVEAEDEQECDEVAGAAPDDVPAPVGEVIPHAPVQIALVRGEEGAELTVAPGGEVETQVRVRNDGDNTALFELRVEGIPSTWWTADPPRLHLNPRHSAEASEAVAVIRFAPPRSAEASAGRRVAAIHATQRDSGSAPADESVVVGLTILPYGQLTARVRPDDVAGFRRGRFAVEVENQGNDALDADLEMRDRRDACTFRHEHRTRIAPGERQRVETEVRARRLRWFGGRSTMRWRRPCVRAAVGRRPLEPRSGSG